MHGSELGCKTGAPAIGAWKCNFPPFLANNDRPADRPRDHREVSLPLITIYMKKVTREEVGYRNASAVCSKCSDRRSMEVRLSVL